MPTRSHSEAYRSAASLLVVLGLVALALLAAGPAAASSCGDRVIDDWYDGRIDGTYPLPCYEDAIDQLPRDLRDYSSAPDDIMRALQAAKRGKPAPPNKDPAPAAEEPDDTPPAPPPDDDPPTATAPPETRGVDTVASPTDTGSSASSVPVPLLVLAGLALLLIAGGSAGYVIRRYQARRIPPPTP